MILPKFSSGFMERPCSKLSRSLERFYIYLMATLTPFTTWTTTSPWPTTTSSLTPSDPWWKPWDCRLSPSLQSWLAGPRRELFIISTWLPAELRGNRSGTRCREYQGWRRITKTFHDNIMIYSSSLYFNNNYTKITRKVGPRKTFTTHVGISSRIKIFIKGKRRLNLNNRRFCSVHDLVSSEDQLVSFSLCSELNQFLRWEPFYPVSAWETQICLGQRRLQNILDRLRSSFWWSW